MQEVFKQKLDFTEDGLVEQPAIELFNQLGWRTLNCWLCESIYDSSVGK